MALADLLVHVHIQKCAGTSLWYWMARHHPGSHGFLYPRVPSAFYYDEAALVELGIGNVQLRCVSSHFFRIFPEQVAGRKMRYFTLLREPVAHFVSWARYARTFAREINDQGLYVLPAGIESMTPREYANWLLECPDDLPFRENFQTNFLASCVWREETGRGPRPSAAQRWDPDDWAAYRSVRLQLAMDALARFAVVGTVERFAESLRILQSAATAWGLDLGPLEDVGHINATEGVYDADWIRDSDPVGRRLLASLQEDRQLYAFAGTLLDRQLDAVR